MLTEPQNKPRSQALCHIVLVCIFRKMLLFKMFQAKYSEVNYTCGSSFSKGIGSLLKSHCEKPGLLDYREDLGLGVDSATHQLCNPELHLSFLNLSFFI